MSKERKFKVGDRVVTTESIFAPRDVLGTIIADKSESNSGTSYLVEFDKNVGGHNGNCGRRGVAFGKQNHCWYIDPMGLKLVSPDWKVLITPEGDTTTARLYENNKVVKSVSTKKHPDDEYSMETACEVLMDRLFPKTEIVKQDKYEVGDKVKVRDDLASNKLYYMSNKANWDDVTHSMMALRGKVVTIKEVRENRKYGIHEFGYNWTDEMFEGKVVDKRKVESKPEEPEKPKHKFEVGDIVELTATDYPMPKGTRGVVVCYNGELTGVDFKFEYPNAIGTHSLNDKIDKPTGYWIIEPNLKKVN